MFLGLTSWQWLVVCIMAGASLIAALMLSKVLGGVMRALLRRFQVHAEVDVLRAVSRSVAFGIVVEVMRIFIPELGVAENVLTTLRLWCDGLAVAFLTVAAYRITDLVCHKVVDHALRHRSNGRDAARTLGPLVGSGVKVLVIVIGTTTLLGLLGVNVTAIITGLSIGGAALALASQDTIRNVFGSAMILADQPFVVGDWIVLQGVDGVVEEIGFRSTRIRTFADSVVTIPNGRLADLTIENLGLRRLRRFRTVLAVEHGYSAEELESFTSAIHSMLAQHEHTVKDEGRIVVALTEITSNGCAITITAFADVEVVGNEAQFRHEINMGVIRVARALNIRMASNNEGSTRGTA